MSVIEQALTISEWETMGPESSDLLHNHRLPETATVRQVVEQLASSRLLQLTELRYGLQVKAFSHVGRLRIGNLTITVVPKIQSSSLLGLLRYAYGFRNLNLLSDANHSIQQSGFEDLLVAQLVQEVHELLSRGLRRAYVSRDERLASPRGRIDVGRVVRDGGVMTATLPCSHYPRVEDTLLNQTLKAGLMLASSMASNLQLRRDARRLVALMDESVSTIKLNAFVLRDVERQLNRLSKAYAPSVSIIRLLYESKGITLDGESTVLRLPGFMFDMNAFFQALVSRFLRDNLLDYEVKDEHSLKKMMRYHPDYNPQRKQSPTPRPDYAVIKQGKVVALLDAKYRDLWEKQLPREMLYQLVVYAISQKNSPRSCILYPTSNPLAKEARIEVIEPILGTRLGQVCLRHVNLNVLEQMIRDTSPDSPATRQAEARRIAFGQN